MPENRDNFTLDQFGNQVSLVGTDNQCYSSNSPTEATYSTTQTTATVNCVLETIPVPRINHITNLLCTTKPSIFNKPEAYVDEAGNTVYQTLINNILEQSGGTHSFKVQGDLNTNYKLIIKDITNSKYWDFYSLEWENGLNKLDEDVSSPSNLWM